MNEIKGLIKSIRLNAKIFRYSSLICLFLVLYDLTISPFQIASVVVLTLFCAYVFWRNRGHLKRTCIHEVLSRNCFFNLTRFIPFVYLLFEMCRPLWSSSASIRLTAIYWPIQTFLMYATLMFLSHSIECPGTVTNSGRLTNVAHITSGITLYLISIEVIFLLGDIYTHSGLILTSSTTQLLPYFALNPLIWLQIARFPRYILLNTLPVFLAFLISIQIESRATLMLVTFTTLFGCAYLMLHRGISLSVRLRLLIQVFLGFVLLVSVSLDKFARLFADTLVSGKVRRLDSGVIEVVDLDRKIHFITSLDVIAQNWYNFLLGFGFRESSFILAQPLFEIYQEKLPYLNFEDELGDFSNVSTFGLNALFVDLGLVGFGLLSILVLLQLINLPWRNDFSWSVIRLISIISFFSILYVNNYTHTAYFFTLVFFGALLDIPNKNLKLDSGN